MNHPDLLIVNAQIWAPDQTEDTALLLRDGRILAKGTETEMSGIVREDAVRLDAGGGALLPGFHDAHIHAQAGGLGLLGCDLDAEHSVAGYSRLIREYAEKTEERWVVGAGWFGDAFPEGLPSRELLDELVPERPAVFTSHDAHSVWVNSEALRLAGVDAHTEDPPAGRIGRGVEGELTGMLFDAAGELVTRLIPPLNPARLRAGLLAAQQHLFSLGVTAWHDAILGAYLTLPDCLPSYLETLSDGSLLGRVTGSLWWPPAEGPDYLPDILQQLRDAQRAGFDVRSVKIMQDGICENCTAALIEPYSGVQPTQRGDSVISPAHLNEITTVLDRHGVSVHFHGVGDRAIRECLDAVEQARSANGPGMRHQIAHLDVVDPADIPRFAELGVTANIQALWARNDQEILERKYPLIGEDRARYHFPFGSLSRAGAHLAMGSDWPVTSPNPLWALHTACTRTAPAADVHALNTEATVPAQPQEVLEVEEALRAYTLGAAEIAGTAHEMGSLNPGKRADLVLLDGPITGPSSFDGLRVARTILGGETVYARG